MQRPASRPARQPVTLAAVVANPVTLRSGNRDPARFRAAVRAALTRQGWPEPLWLETTRDDPGAGLARAAIAARAGLVLAAGGDGTVTACATALAGSGVPLAVLPCGTGNLLARNLGLPLRLRDALRMALNGTDRLLDVGVANGRPFLVMAGAGFDARALDGSAALKRRLGWAAYYLAALPHLRDQPMRVSLQADDGAAVGRRASALVVGNVGALPGGFPLLPDADPGDGLLDAVLLTAGGIPGWIAVGARLLARQAGRAGGQIVRLRFRTLHISLDPAQPWQLDGEAVGSASELAISVRPGQLTLRGPSPALPPGRWSRNSGPIPR